MTQPRESGIARRRALARENGSEEYRARQRQVIQAAARRFHDEGFDRATLADIAADAGIDRANIYYYVESKEELFLLVLLEVKTDVVLTAERIARSDASAAERLRALMVEHMAELDRHYPYLYLHYAECIQTVAARCPDEPHLHRVLRLTERHYAAFRVVAREGINDGSFVTPLPAGVLAQTAIGMVLQSKTWFHPAKSRFTAGELGHALADALLGGLCPRGKPPRRRRTTPPDHAVRPNSRR